MEMSQAKDWTDDEVRTYFASHAVPLEQWSVSYECELYGFCSEGELLWACADDDEQRSHIVVDYLRRIGARRI